MSSNLLAFSRLVKSKAALLAAGSAIALGSVALVNYGALSGIGIGSEPFPDFQPAIASTARANPAAWVQSQRENIERAFQEGQNTLGAYKQSEVWLPIAGAHHSLAQISWEMTLKRQISREKLAIVIAESPSLSALPQPAPLSGAASPSERAQASETPSIPDYEKRMLRACIMEGSSPDRCLGIDDAKTLNRQVRDQFAGIIQIQAHLRKFTQAYLTAGWDHWNESEALIRQQAQTEFSATRAHFEQDRDNGAISSTELAGIQEGLLIAQTNALDQIKQDKARLQKLGPNTALDGHELMRLARWIAISPSANPDHMPPEAVAAGASLITGPERPLLQDLFSHANDNRTASRAIDPYSLLGGRTPFMAQASAEMSATLQGPIKEAFLAQSKARAQDFGFAMQGPIPLLREIANERFGHALRQERARNPPAAAFADASQTSVSFSPAPSEAPATQSDGSPMNGYILFKQMESSTAPASPPSPGFKR